MKTFIKLFKNEEGATAIEYGLIAALIAVALIGTLTSLGGSLNTTFTSAKDSLDGAQAGASSGGTTSGGTTSGGTTTGGTTTGG